MAAKFVRMSHNKRGVWCPAWEILDDALRLYKTGKEPFRASQARWPNGDPIKPGDRMACGTCGATNFNIAEMKVAPVPTTP